jgi:hypothetical protein
LFYFVIAYNLLYTIITIDINFSILELSNKEIVEELHNKNVRIKFDDIIYKLLEWKKGLVGLMMSILLLMIYDWWVCDDSLWDI